MDNNLEKNIEVIKKEYNNSPDIISRTITINNKKIALMYNQSLCDSKHINNFILKNISYSIELDKKLTITSVFDFFYNSSPANNVIKIDSYKDIYEYLSNSYTIILFDNVKEAIAIETKENLSEESKLLQLNKLLVVQKIHLMNII